jgi:hypothetical protein
LSRIIPIVAGAAFEGEVKAMKVALLNFILRITISTKQ